MNLRSNLMKRCGSTKDRESRLELCAPGIARSAAARVLPTQCGGGDAETMTPTWGELRWAFLVAGFALTTAFAGCALTQQASVSGENYCPFLGAKLCAKLTPGTSGQLDLRYVNPNAQWTQYKKVMIEPVTFWGSEDTTISAADQRELTNFMYQALEAQLSQKFQVVNKPGPGVMVIQTALLAPKRQ